MVNRRKQHGAIVRGPWYEAAIVYGKDRHGNPTARLAGVRYRKRSPRYWRAVLIAVIATARLKLRGK